VTRELLTTTLGVSRHALVSAIVADARLYRQYQRAELRLTNQIGAFVRMLSGDLSLSVTPAGCVADLEDEGDRFLDATPHADVALVPPKPRDLTKLIATLGMGPIVEARDFLTKHRESAARNLGRQAVQLPVWDSFVRDVRGCGPLGLALIVGEAGDLSNYSNPAKLWKRLGLAVGSDGRAQRRVANDASEAMEQGYSPRRRSLMHVVGECLLKQNDGAYRAAYDERKDYEIARRPDAPLIHNHKRALRYMEKRFLLHLWQAWRREAIDTTSTRSVMSLDADVHEVLA
jgi:hypothetical protein